MVTLDCAAKVMRNHMDNVEKSEGLIKAYKYDLAGTIYQRVWLAIQLLYDNAGLRIDRICVSTFMDPDGIPDQDRFEDRTEEYINSPDVLKLLNAIDSEIKKNCAERDE